MTRRLIVTADDFGASTAINHAVERGHGEGCLTAASLMVTGDAVDDAVARARRLPELGVGLHLVLVEGRPALPPAALPALVDASGHFRTDMARLGADIFFKPAARRQLRAEIAAQFAAFAATGLPLDHVNAHKHFHLHPTIAGIILEVGRGYGMKAMRAPVEPIAILRGIEPVQQAAATRIADLWARLLRRRLRRAGMVVPDQVFGLAWSGAMTAVRVASLIDRAPMGITELYLHPATDKVGTGHAPGYRYTDEFAALIDPGVRQAITRSGARLTPFAALTEA
ncbi:hopanoid biosynthesis-associated protein HpnK [Sphingomonas sp. 28-63-12]|uniref:hopanoid biosynthesis-associated protein HpnK n=1 Tax=Sphingomonas sp. 28-63-12 TaxID=1970434 RepID=UPI000BD6A2FD|nr:MAG: PTS cellobiose transporter [Sphingomonas sp. 28-63-12]